MVPDNHFQKIIIQQNLINTNKVKFWGEDYFIHPYVSSRNEVAFMSFSADKADTED